MIFWLKKLGIHLASKCICCDKPHEESAEHLFIEGELATYLWNFFGSVFAVPCVRNQSVYARIAWWVHRCKGNSQFAMLGRLARLAICSQLWSYRNNTIYGGMSKNIEAAKFFVINTLRDLDILIKPKKMNGDFGVDSLLMLCIPSRSPPRKMPRLCRWVPPPPQKLIVNVHSLEVNKSLAVGGEVG